MVLPSHIVRCFVAPYLESNSVRCLFRTHSAYKDMAGHVLSHVRHQDSDEPLRIVYDVKEVVVPGKHVIWHDNITKECVLQYLGKHGYPEDDGEIMYSMRHILAECAPNCDRDDKWLVLETMLAACERGHFGVVQMLTPMFRSLHDTDKYKYSQTQFNLACQQGHLDIAKWLMNNGCVPDDQESLVSVVAETFTITCSHGHLNVLTWLLETFPDTVRSTALEPKSLTTRFFPGPSHPFYDACVFGQLHVAKWLMATFYSAMDRETVVSKFTYISLLDDCLVHSHLCMTMWLLETFPLPRCYHHSLQENLAFICGSADLRVLKWLRDKQILTKERFLKISRWHGSCWKSLRLDVIKWLVNEFDLEPHDMFYQEECGFGSPLNVYTSVFYRACTENHFDVALWLYRKFGKRVTADECVNGNTCHECCHEHFIFYDACANSNGFMAKWIHDTFTIPAQIAKRRYLKAFYGICRTNNLDFAQWFHRTFIVTPDEFKACCDYRGEKLSDVCDSQMNTWLRNTFPS